MQIAAHSSDFVYGVTQSLEKTSSCLANNSRRIAGSETTATALACITYYLQKNPDILHTLQQEVRTSFESYEQINDASTAPLEYLKAVILEGMRMYPPLPFPLPRVVPSEGGVVDGNFVPGGVSVVVSLATSFPWIRSP